MIKKLSLGLILVIAIALAWGAWRLDYEQRAATSLTPDGAYDPTIFVAPNFVAQSLPLPNEYQNPYMANFDAATMHGSASASDVHAGPFAASANLFLASRRAGGALPRQCPTFTFTRQGVPVILCGGLTSFRLNLIDPKTLDQLDYLDLPMRPSAFQAIIHRNLNIVFDDTSGGAYFYLDNHDRVVVADSRQQIRRIPVIKDEADQWVFGQEEHWDMRAYVPNDCQHYDNWWPTGECDAITSVMPDSGGRIWWVTRAGRYGYLDPNTGQVQHAHFHEEVQNGMASDEKHIYILTDHAIHALQATNTGPDIVWRQSYDRGSTRKLGSINQGSGTTPSLLGQDFITFADNADGQINLVVLRRMADIGDDGREVCRVPLFNPGQSATENSIITYGRSIIVENNFGYRHAEAPTDWSSIPGGVMRIDVEPSGRACNVIWQSDLVVPSVVPKLSLANGLVYFVSFDEVASGRVWSLVGLDFRDGKIRHKIPLGTGKAFNNNWSSIALSPQGQFYVGTRQGFVQITSAPQ